MRLAALVLVLLAAGGCNDLRPDPPPIAEIEIAADGSHRLDGRLMPIDRLERELSRRAAEAQNEKLGRTRLQVRIRSVEAPYERVLELQERCQRLGISHVEVPR